MKILNFRLAAALQAVLSGKMSVRGAGEKFQVGRASLQRRKSQPEKSFERQTVILHKAEEQELASWTLTSAHRGRPMSRQDILREAHKMKKAREGPEAAAPSTTWLKLFLKRHALSPRTPQNLSYASACLTRDNLLNWAKEVEEGLRADGVFEILNDPSRVLNCDESFVQFDPPSRKVIDKRGSKNVFEVQNNAKEGVTVLLTVRADGQKCKPLVVMPYIRIPSHIQSNFPTAQAHLSNTPSGWMHSETFCGYLRMLAKELKESGVNLPDEKVILFLDNHASHVGLEPMKVADELGIYVVALYPNSTFVLQPADVGCFGPLKKYWREAVKQRKMAKHDFKTTNANFTTIFVETLSKLNENTVKNAFRACGLCPWNPNAIDFSKCLGKTSSDTVITSQSTTAEAFDVSIDDIPTTSRYSDLEYTLTSSDPLEEVSMPPTPSSESVLCDENLRKALEGTLPVNIQTALLQELAHKALFAQTPTAEAPACEEIIERPEEIIERPEEIIEAPQILEILPLPPIPARKNKRTVKRKSYLLSSPGNIEGMIGESNKKLKIAEDKELKKIERLGKRKTNIEEQQRKLQIAMSKAKVPTSSFSQPLTASTLSFGATSYGQENSVHNGEITHSFTSSLMSSQRQPFTSIQNDVNLPL